MKVSVEGGAGLPAERAGGTGTSDDAFENGDSIGFVMPRPVFNWAVAAFVDEVRSGWLAVGVVGDGSALSPREMDAEGLSAEGFSESPRAGRSTRWLELKDEPDVSGESCTVAGGDGEKFGSIKGRLSRADMSIVGEPCCCC